MKRVRPIVIAVMLVTAATSLSAQEADSTPSFTLASSQIFNTREPPAISLYHRRIDHLDFRVYRVNDAFAAGVSGRRVATIGRGSWSIRLIALGATCAGVIAVTQGLWRVAFWRPPGLPASGVEMVFVTMKLVVLYALASAIAAAVLWAHRPVSPT